MAFDVHRRIDEIRNADPTVVLDEHLFTTVGAEFGIKKTLCNQLYYAVETFVRMADMTMPASLQAAIEDLAAGGRETPTRRF